MLGAEKQTRKDDVGFGLGLRDGDAGLEAADQRKSVAPVAHAIIEDGGTEEVGLRAGENTEPKSKVGGRTPMTVTGLLSRVMAWPTMPVSAAN